MNEVPDIENRECDDVAAAIREDRPLRPSRAYLIAVSDESLEFRQVQVVDPIPLGRQVLAAAGVEAVKDCSLFAILASGDFEDVRLDEPFDLRGRGAERFVFFLTDRLYKFTLNDHQLQWGKPRISGTALYKLAKPAPGHAVYLDVPGGKDRLVELDELVDLNEAGVERFITALNKPQTYEIIVNSRPITVPRAEVTFEQVVEIAFPGPQGPNVTFSMTYQHAASKPHSGELGPGGVIEVKKEGTVFNVTRTFQS